MTLCSFCWLKNETSKKKRFPVLRQNQSKFCLKTCWKEQPLIFTVCLMNHLFQTSVLFNNVIMECIVLNWLCKHMKKVRSSQVAILVLKWVKQFFPVSIVNCEIRATKSVIQFEFNWFPFKGTLMQIWNFTVCLGS